MTTVRVDNVRRYKLRLERFSWAEIVMDAAGGLLMIYSDYGTYAHHWTDPGGEFRAFLIKCDADYIMGKFGAHDWFDAEATNTAAERAINAAEIDSNLKVEALTDLGTVDADSARSWLDSVYAYDILVTALNDEPATCIVCNYQPQLRMFMEKFWPMFIAELKRELAAGEPANTPVVDRDGVLEEAAAVADKFANAKEIHNELRASIDQRGTSDGWVPAPPDVKQTGASIATRIRKLKTQKPE